jgi:hypothetical protein
VLRVRTDLGSSKSIYRLVPLVGSTVKKEVICWVGDGPGCGYGWTRGAETEGLLYV